MLKRYYIKGKALDMDKELVEAYTKHTYSFEGTQAFEPSFSLVLELTVNPNKTFEEIYDTIGKEKAEQIISDAFKDELDFLLNSE